MYLTYFTIALLLILAALKLLIRYDCLAPEQMRLIWPLIVLGVAGYLWRAARRSRQPQADQPAGPQSDESEESK